MCGPYKPEAPITTKNYEDIVECVQGIDEPLDTFIARAAMKSQGAIPQEWVEEVPIRVPCPKEAPIPWSLT